MGDTTRMTDVLRELRATSDSLMRDLEALSVLETEKRSIPFDDPRLVEIANQVEVIAQRILTKTSEQSRLTEVATEKADVVTIEDVRRPIADILGEWRDAERRVAEAEPGSAEEADARLLASSLRDEYARSFSDTQRP